MHKKILRYGKRAFISWHFIRFLLVGGTNTALDMSVFLVLSSALHLPVILSNILSTSAALCLSFFLNKHFVFKAEGTTTRHFVQFVGWTLFNVWLVQAVVIVMSTPLIETFTDEKWQINAGAKVCAIGVSMILNFLGYRFIFKTDKPA